MIKDKLKGQLLEEPLVSTRGSDLYFKSLVNGYITNFFTLRGVPLFSSILNIPSSDVFIFNNNVLYRSNNKLMLYPDEELLNLTTNSPLSYVVINNYLYGSNGSVLFKMTSPFDISVIPEGDIDDFLAYMPSGFPIGHDRGRLLSAKGNLVYFSNLWEFDIYDKKINLFQMDSRVVTFCSVPEGLIIGTNEGYYLYTYMTNITEGRLTKIYDSPARSINYIFFGGRYYFMSEDGLVIYPEPKNITFNKHSKIDALCRLSLLSFSHADLIHVEWVL